MSRESSELWANLELLDINGDPRGTIAQFDVDSALFGRDEDFDVSALRCLQDWQDTHQSADRPIDPGTYRFTVHSDWSGDQIGMFEMALPLPELLRDLDDDSRRSFLRDRRDKYRRVPTAAFVEHIATFYAHSTGEKYGGMSTAMFIEHIDSFHAHDSGKISDQELARRTGFVARKENP